MAWPLNSEAVQTSSRPKAVSQSAKLIPLAFFAAINVAVTVSCEGAARDGGLGAGKQSLLDSRNRHRLKKNIPPRNVTATVKLSGSATKRNAAIATKLMLPIYSLAGFGANCATVSYESLERPQDIDRHVAYVVQAEANARERQVGRRHVGATGPGLALGRGAGGVGFAVGVPKCRYHVTVL